jgi:hypothetical protein
MSQNYMNGFFNKANRRWDSGCDKCLFRQSNMALELTT